MKRELIVIRADASYAIGSGHVMRTLVLAIALKSLGMSICFICRKQPGDYIEILRDKGFDVVALPAIRDHDESWLGLSWQEDAAHTISALPYDTDIGWMIIDHYGIDARWEQLLISYVKKILVIDDLANRPHISNLLLDYNYVDRINHRYNNLVLDTTKLLLGPLYAILRDDYKEFYSRRKRSLECVERVIVFFGGTDQHNLTEKTLKILSDIKLQHLYVDCFVSSDHVFYENLKKRIALMNYANLHLLSDQWPTALAKADLFIGAGGTTSWERCFLGVPSIVITVADNQRSATTALAVAGVVSYLGHYDNVSDKKIYEEICRLINDKYKLNQMRKNGQRLVDGNGVGRIIKIMVTT